MLAGGHMKDRAGVSIFAQGEVICAVCAPNGTPRQLVVGRVEAMNPTAFGDAGWKVFDGILPDGRPNPRVCPHDESRHHWFLVRDIEEARVAVASDPLECFM
jgi:hypothetical protein